MQEELIREFRDTYADQFASGMSNFLGRDGQTILGMLQNSIGTSRATVYLFGNGGSYAISKCLEYALQTYALSRGLPLRTQTGIDVHSLSLPAANGTVGVSFLDVLNREGATRNDIVVLISGSGNSDNLCDAADYTARRSIPTLALVGSSRGKLCDFVPQAHCFWVQPEDQQISEDVIQSIAYFVEHSASVCGQANSSKFAMTTAETLRRVVAKIPVAFIASIANLLVESFYEGRFVWVLGLDHPVLSVCAEHTAHNLYWDSIYEVRNPPERLVRSLPTGCDYSGISNDRRRGVMSDLIGSSNSDNNGLAILYSMNSDNPALKDLLRRLDEQEVPVFLFCSEIDLPVEHSCVTVFETGIKQPQIQAGVSQILGHILGRVTRMNLLEREGPKLMPNAASFLADFDLAQRRLLDG